MGKFTTFLAATIMALTAVWGLGLLAFVGYVSSMREGGTDAARTEAIVVLTGGSERIETGIELLKHGLGDKLFISGVGPKTASQDILARRDLAPELRGCCVVLGHSAADTIGNAEETLGWMRREDYRSMRLVTANYHMPRSLLEFRMLDSRVRIVQHPVAPDRVLLEGWWARWGTARLLMTEYDKFLVALLRFAYNRLNQEFPA